MYLDSFNSIILVVIFSHSHISERRRSKARNLNNARCKSYSGECGDELYKSLIILNIDSIITNNNARYDT